MNPGQTTFFGAKDTLVIGQSQYIFWDLVFGRDSILYASFSSPTNAFHPGVAKFNLAGKTWPLKISDTTWTVRADSGLAGTTAIRFGGAANGSQDVLYFVEARIPRSGLIDGARVLTFIRQYARDRRMEDLDIPCAVVATDLASGAEVVLKLENLQVTGAFKERGAANRLSLLTEAERERLRFGIYVGLPVRPDSAGRGDYLIRALLGGDRARGLIAVGDRVAVGQQVRLHVSDAGTAREDLELLLSPQVFDTPAHAALLFACNGRGRGLYGAPDGDIGPLQAALGGATPAAGMFCAGEVGPVGARSFLHGQAASIAVIRPL